MRFALILAFMFLVGVFYAQQSLGSGYFIYNNVSVNRNSGIVVGLNSNNSIDLIVINSADFGSFQNSQQVPQLYNSSAGTGIYRLSVGPGNYTVIFEANRQTELIGDALAEPVGYGKVVNLSSSPYLYPLNLGNFSTVNISILSTTAFSGNPVYVNISDDNFTINSDSNFESINTTLNRGQYYVDLQSQNPTQAYIEFNDKSALVNPLSEINGSETYPIGVVSYGLYNNSGMIVPYQVSTGEVVGVANITELRALNLNKSENLSSGGASLQLNLELDTHVGKSDRTYWLQDVADFNTSNDTFYLVDNIWNNTLPDAVLSNFTFKGNGNVTTCSSCDNQSFYAFTYPNSSLNYSLPLNLKLVVVENQTAGGTQISFGYQVIRSGSAGLGPLVFFDKVLIPGSGNSTILVTPYYQTPSLDGATGSYYDAEFVFGGEADGAVSQFTGMNASLWMYYLKGGAVTPFPSAYTFGLSTAESASGIKTSPYKYGGLVALGSPDFSESILVSNSINVAAQVVQNSSKYTTTTSNYTTVPYLQPSTPNQSSLSSYENYIIYAVVGLVVIVVVLSLLLRRANR